MEMDMRLGLELELELERETDVRLSPRLVMIITGMRCIY
jgi:hypothetical protein